MTSTGRAVAFLLPALLLTLTACSSAPSGGPDGYTAPTTDASAPPALPSATGGAAIDSAPVVPIVAAEPDTAPSLPDCDHLLTAALYEEFAADPRLEPFYERAAVHLADWTPHTVLLDEGDRLCLWGEAYGDYSLWYGVGAISTADREAVRAALTADGYTEVGDPRGLRLEYLGDGPYDFTSPYLLTPDGYAVMGSTSELLDAVYESAFAED